VIVCVCDAISSIVEALNVKSFSRMAVFAGSALWIWPIVFVDPLRLQPMAKTLNLFEKASQLFHPCLWRQIVEVVWIRKIPVEHAGIGDRGTATTATASGGKGVLQN